MRLLHVLLLVLFTIQIFVETRSIMPTTTTLSPTTQVAVRSERPKFNNAIRYKVSDSSQFEIFDDEEEDSDESSTSNPTVDPSFAELSRQAFLHLNQGQQYIKPVAQSDEDRRLLWLGDHQRRKDEKKDNELPGKRTIITTVDQLDRNQTCKSDMFQHKVRLAGCKSKIIINRFCHGSCSSFYIPKLRSKKLKATFKSCAACVPVETDFVKVQLDCPDRAEKQMFRTVVRVKRCACRNIQFGDGDEDNED